jgi:hypothetical protein
VKGDWGKQARGGSNGQMSTHLGFQSIEPEVLAELAEKTMQQGEKIGKSLSQSADGAFAPPRFGIKGCPRKRGTS